MIGNGNFPGRNAFSASRSSTIESLPPLNRSTGRSNSAATSRMMKIDSASRDWRCESSYMESTLRLVLARPAPLTPLAGQRARLASDRGVALVVERVVGKIVLEDVVPDVLLGPVGERVDLPDIALVVALELGGGGPRRRLLTADAGDPRLDAGQRPLEPVDLGGAAAVRLRPRRARTRGIDHLDRQSEALLEALPGLERLGEEDAGVDREQLRARLDLAEHVREHRLLLLEGAGRLQPWVELLDGVGQYLVGGGGLEIWSGGTHFA